MSGSQLVCIKRSEHSLSSIFEEMYINERLVDVTLSCCDGQLQAHRLVLAACSSYFSNLFDKLANPFHFPVVVIKDMQIEDLRLIVEFMYKGQLTVSQEKLMTLAKCAEGLQINGLSNYDSLVTNPVDASISSRSLNQRSKRGKKTHLIQNQLIFSRVYQQSRNDSLDTQSSPQPDKLLEQSMISGESIDNVQQLSYQGNDPTSSRNINNQQQQTISPTSHSLQIQELSGLDNQQQQQQQLTNQLQVLSHSLAANRSSITQVSINSHPGGQSSQQQNRARLHPCQICWKSFREKANLKRHLQVHSIDRVIYACPDCNKTFSWKDNYIRHTKTAHHINNARHSS